MKQVKAIHATPENFKDFGVVTRLTDNDCFQGEGWKCWMTDDVCMDQPAHFGMTYVKTYPPYAVSYTHPPRFLLFIDLVQVGTALAHDINRMVLSVACRKAFVGENVVVHRNDGAAAAAKEAAKRDNRRGFTVAVHDARAVIVVDDVQMLVLEIAAHGRMAGREILTVLRAADADAVAVLEVFRRLHKRRHQLIAANGRIVGRHIGLRHALVAHNATGDDHIARVQLFTDRHAAAKAQEGVGPVSCTHLDVYKRQVLACLTTELFFSFIALRLRLHTQK